MKMISIASATLLLSLAAFPVFAADEQAPPMDDMAGMTISEKESAQGSGLIEEIDIDGKRVKLNHKAVPELGMNAMTMFFGVGRDVDLTKFSVGNHVSFNLKKGRDNAFRVMKMCISIVSETDCLEELAHKHPGDGDNHEHGMPDTN